MVLEVKAVLFWGSDFEASMEGEHNERVYKSVGEIRPWQFEPPERT